MCKNYFASKILLRQINEEAINSLLQLKLEKVMQLLATTITWKFL